MLYVNAENPLINTSNLMRPQVAPGSCISNRSVGAIIAVTPFHLHIHGLHSTQLHSEGLFWNFVEKLVK